VLMLYSKKVVVGFDANRTDGSVASIERGNEKRRAQASS